MSRLAPTSVSRRSAAERRPKTPPNGFPPGHFHRSPTTRFLLHAQRRRTWPGHEPVRSPRPALHDFACWPSNFVRRLHPTTFTLGRFLRGPSTRPARIRTFAQMARPPCTQMAGLPRSAVHDFVCWPSNLVRRLDPTTFTLGRLLQSPATRPAYPATLPNRLGPFLHRSGTSPHRPRLRVLAVEPRPKTPPDSVHARPLVVGSGHPTCAVADCA